MMNRSGAFKQHAQCLPHTHLDFATRSSASGRCSKARVRIFREVHLVLGPRIRLLRCRRVAARPRLGRIIVHGGPAI